MIEYSLELWHPVHHPAVPLEWRTVLAEGVQEDVPHLLVWDDLKPVSDPRASSCYNVERAHKTSEKKPGMVETIMALLPALSLVSLHLVEEADGAVLLLGIVREVPLQPILRNHLLLREDVHQFLVAAEILVDPELLHVAHCCIDELNRTSPPRVAICEDVDRSLERFLEGSGQ